MTCTHCGTEIADKALICFRCGRSTTETPDPGRLKERVRRRPLWPTALALVVLIGAGLFMARATIGGVPDWLRWTIAGGAAIVLGVRLWWRMRR